MLLDQTVLQAKRFGVITCSQMTSLGEAAGIMAAEDISALVVTDDAGYLAGVITRTDLLRALTTLEDWAPLPVKTIMSTEVVTVPSHASLRKVAGLLLDKHIHRIIVTREEAGKQRPVSVISAADLVYHMAKAAKAG